MIYDCFSYWDEDLLLDLRLNILDNYVDYFVIVEGNKTWQNNPKKLRFEIDKFKKFKNKIIYVPVTDLPDGEDPYLRENHQRNAIVNGLNNANDNDVIIISDLDEIPDPRKINLFDPKKASAGAWIFAIARNSRIDLIRKENRPEADTTDPFFEQNEPESPLAVLETERKSKLLRDFVRELPAEQQQVLKLAFYEEKPHSEVAEELGIPLGTVKSRIRLAFKRIRSEFGEI